MQLALEEEVGEVPHGVGPKSCDVIEFAGLLPPQSRHPLYNIVGDLQGDKRN